MLDKSLGETSVIDNTGTLLLLFCSPLCFFFKSLIIIPAFIVPGKGSVYFSCCILCNLQFMLDKSVEDQNSETDNTGNNYLIILSILIC